MISAQQQSSLVACYRAAVASGHVWPAYAACEGAVESGWFTSQLYLQDNNLFGTKQHEHPIFGTHNIPTREFLQGKWVVVDAAWVKYPTLADSFADRMRTLTVLAKALNSETKLPEYPHYIAALAATTGEEFITQVSLTWSTGPTRGADVLSTYRAHKDLFTAAN